MLHRKASNNGCVYFPTLNSLTDVPLFLAAYRLQKRLIADPNFGNLTGEAREKALQEISDKVDFATDAV